MRRFKVRYENMRGVSRLCRDGTSYNANSAIAIIRWMRKEYPTCNARICERSE